MMTSWYIEKKFGARFGRTVFHAMCKAQIVYDLMTSTTGSSTLHRNEPSTNPIKQRLELIMKDTKTRASKEQNEEPFGEAVLKRKSW